MAYNTTALDNSVTLFDYFSALNVTFHGWLADLVLMVIFLVVFISTKGFDTRVCMITSSGITSFFAILFWGLGFVSMATIFIPVAMLFGSMIWFSFGD